MATGEIIEKEKCRRVLKIDIPASEVKAEFEKIYRGLIENASIPGFRKGKAPLNIVKARYSKWVREEVMQRLIYTSMWDVFEKKNLEILCVPRVEEGELDPERDFSYRVTVEVRPEINLGDYNRMKLTIRVREIKQEDIDSVVRTIQERMARYIAIEKEELAPGDYALVDIKVTEKGEERVNRERVVIYADDSAFCPGFGEKIKGLKKGEEREMVLTVLAKEGKEALEKEMNFWIRLIDIREKRLPPVDNELAKDMGFETLEGLKAEIRKRLEEWQGERIYDEMCRQIDEGLLKIGDLVPPECIVRHRADTVLKEIRHNMERDGKKEEYRKNEEELKKIVYEDSIRWAKLAYLLDEIGRRENIDVSREEIEQILRNIFGNDEDGLRRARERLTREEKWEDYALMIRERKIYHHIMARAEITERRE